jgi:hypothetical protein
VRLGPVKCLVHSKTFGALWGMRLELVLALYFGQYGIFAMILSLTNKSFPSFLQVVPLVTHWIRMWSFTQPEDVRHDMDIGCNRLAMVALDLDGSHEDFVAAYLFLLLGWFTWKL